MDKSCRNCKNKGNDDIPWDCPTCNDLSNWEPKPGTWISEKFAEVSNRKIPTKLINTTNPIFLPSRKYPNDAGADLRARIPHNISLSAGEMAKIPTGIGIEIPPNHVGIVTARSGATTDGKVTLVGVIDADYRGEIGLNVVNMSKGWVQIFPAERLAQIIIVPCLITEFEQVEELSESDRGIRGFGSSGKF